MLLNAANGLSKLSQNFDDAKYNTITNKLLAKTSLNQMLADLKVNVLKIRPEELDLRYSAIALMRTG